MKTKALFFLVVLMTLTFEFSAQNTHYIYVSDAGGFTSQPWQILRYDLDGTNPQVFISNQDFVANGVGWPQDILFLEDQNVVLISCLVGNKITKHDADSGAYIDDFATIPGGPTRMKIGTDDLIYVLQWSATNNKVLRFQQDGTALGEYTDVGVARSIGMDWDNAGNMYISSYSGSYVQKFDTNGMFMEEFINTELAGPTNIMFEGNGNLLALNWSGNNVKRFDASGNFLGTFTTSITQPEGITVHPVNDNYLIGNGGNGSVDMFQSDGTFVESTIPSGSGGLMQPNAVVIRDATLSTESFIKPKVFVTPTFGSEFKLNTTETQFLDSLELYNTQGEKVASLPLDVTIWNADRLSEGLYILTATKGDSKFSQKIIVQK